MTTTSTGAITVVVCDDHLVLAQGLAAMLAAEGDIVVAGVVGTVADLVATVNLHQPDVVLVDYELPDGDGVAVTATLKAAYPDVQVVMLTSYTNQAVLVAALEAGCSGYLTKHSAAHVVADAVRQAAAGEAIITASLLHQLLPQLATTGRPAASVLTGREVEVLELLADGVSGQAIAERLYLAPNTVRNHVQAILQKLGVHSRLQAVAVAVQQGIIRRP